MPEQEVEIGIGLKARDRTGLQLIQDTAAGLDKTRQAIANAQKQGGLQKVVAESELQNVNDLTDRAAKLAQELYDTDEALSKLKNTDPGFAEKAKQANDLYDQLVLINAEAAKTPAAIKGAGGVAGAGGGVENKGAIRESIRGVGGLVSQVDPNAGRIAGVATELLQVTDGFKKLSGVLISQPNIIGTVASAGAQLGITFGVTAAALGAVLAVVAPVAIVLAGLALVIKSVSDRADEAAKAEQKYLDALDVQIKTDRELADFLSKGDYEGAKARQAQLVQDQADANAKLTYLYQEKANIDKKYADLGASLNADARAALGAEGKKVQDEIDKTYNDSFVPLTQAVDEFGKSLDKIKEAADQKAVIDEEVKALQNKYQIESQLTELIKAGNVDALEKRKQAIQDELASLRETIPELEKLSTGSDTAAQALQQAQTHQKDLTTELGTYSDQALEAAQHQADLNKETAKTLAGFDQQIQLSGQVSGLIKSASSQGLTDRLDAINTERDAIGGTLDQLTEMAKTSDEAKTKLQQYQDRIKALNGEFDALSAAAPDVRFAEIKKGEDEIVAAETATDRKIADIRTAGLAKIQEIEDSAAAARADALAKRDKAISDANSQENSDIDKTNKTYMASERKAWDKFYADQAKVDDQNKAQRLKIIRDTQDALLDAEKSNDVVAFNAAATRGQKQLDQFDEEAKQRKSDDLARFEDERQAAKEQNDERIQQIKDQAEEARQAAQTQYTEDLDQVEKRRGEAVQAANDQQEQLIAAEEAGLVQRIASIQEKYDLEKAMIDDVFDKRKARYTEDDKIVNDRLDLALSRYADDAKTKADADIAQNTRAVKTKADTETGIYATLTNTIQANFGGVINSIQGGLTGLIANIQANLASAANNITSSGSFGGSSSSGTSPSDLEGGGGSGVFGAGGTAFANEGIVRKPTIALLGENLRQGEVEAAIKFNPSEGLPSGKLGGSNNFYFDSITVGDGITKPELKEIMQEFAMEHVSGIEKARGNKT